MFDLAGVRSFLPLLALSITATGCFVESHPKYNPPDQTSSIPTCPTVSDPAVGVTVDTDIGPKLIPSTGDSISVEYSSGGLWHLQSTCSAGYQCLFEVTAEVFSGSVSNVTGEDLESNDMVGSPCPDTAFMTVNTAGDLDGMIFTAPAGAKIRVTAALDHVIYPNVLQWVENGMLHKDANANPLDLTPASP